MKRFKLRDNVRWRSQAGSYETEKRGEVVEVVPGGVRPRFLRMSKAERPGGVMFDGRPRNHESYVVRVDRGAMRQPRYYWPRVSGLRFQ